MLLKYIDVEFPTADVTPARVSSFRWSQKRYEHDFGVLRFFDWGADTISLTTGTPVKITAKVEDSTKIFYGYVHHTSRTRTKGSNTLDVHVIGASYPLQQPSMRLYNNMTSSDIVKKIAIKHKFSYDIAPHGRVYRQIAQAGRSDWELMVDLAKASGYTLTVDQTTISFKPVSEDFVRLKPFAKEYFSANPSSAVPPRLYSIKTLVGESIRYADTHQAAAAVMGVDPSTGKSFSVIAGSKPGGQRGARNPDLFDRFDTRKIADSYSAAKYEVEAIDELNRFPYRARAVLFGTPDLRPNMPIYISGVDDQVDGYWAVLEATHILEDSTFTTEVLIGQDSLGSTDTLNYTGQNIKSLDTPKLVVSRTSSKPSAPITISKVANRLSATPATAVTALWVGSGKDVRSAVGGVNKTLAILGGN